MTMRGEIDKLAYAPLPKWEIGEFGPVFPKLLTLGGVAELHNSLIDEINRLRAEALSLKERLEESDELLRRHGRHKYPCPFSDDGDDAEHAGPCNCGWSEIYNRIWA